ncbi:nucleotidyltransferase domain-containing protein [Candidatus Pacearchaeota archaeon]|nr:nucleotidyltransferase domain-containing protein [Candidatus Pacearchaeota archaeon]
MTYTEIKEKNSGKYYYRVKSIRNGKKFRKKRIYLGKNISKEDLILKEKESDDKLKTVKKLRILEKIKPKIMEILKKNKIKKAGIFGSYVRGEENRNSDIDILIQPTKNMGFKFSGLEIELSKKLKKKVDLVSYNGLSPHLKNKILSQEVRII